MLKNLRCLGLFIALIFSAVSIPATYADSTNPQIGCVQPKKAVKDLGTLVLASIPANLPAAQWGIEQGCFKKYGLTIKTVTVASPQIGMAGLVSASFDLFLNTPSNLILFMANGNFAGKIVAPRHGYSVEELARAKIEPFYPGRLLLQTALIVGKDSPIKAWKDLANKRIGVKSFKGADHAAVLLALRAKGIDSSQIEFLALADAQMSAALDHGDVDAVIPADPYASQIILDGGQIIGYPTAFYFEPGVAVAYVSTEEITNKKQIAMRAFTKAILEINHLLNQPQSDASYRKTIAQVTGLSDKEAAKVSLPIMMEKNVNFTDVTYIPNKLKSLGFIKTRVNIAPILFR